MPFDIGFGELVLIGIVALIVVGPKDLPGLFRAFGRFTGRMRGMANEFRRTLEAAADDTGLNDVKKDFQNTQNDFEKTQNDLKRSMRIDDIANSAKALEDELSSTVIDNASSYKTSEIGTQPQKTKKPKTQTPNDESPTLLDKSAQASSEPQK